MATKTKKDEAAGAGSEAKGPEFAIQRVYTKDSSLETPNTPAIFREQWRPQLNIDLQTKHNELETNVYEVVLSITITAKIEDKTAFLVEVHQAGIFTAKGFDKEQLDHLMGSYCPSILFPYARERISEVVGHAGFPPFYLAPINFDALYQQQQEQAAKEDKK